MKDSKRTFIGVTYFYNVIKFGLFLVIGIILCLIGIKVRMCLAVGVAFVAFAFIAPAIATYRLFRYIRNDDDPRMQELVKAIDSDEPYKGLDEFTGKLLNDENSDSTEDDE